MGVFVEEGVRVGVGVIDGVGVGETAGHAMV